MDAYWSMQHVMFVFRHHVPDGKCFKLKELFTGLILPEVVINNITVDAINPSSMSNNQNTVVKTCGYLNRVKRCSPTLYLLAGNRTRKNNFPYLSASGSRRCVSYGSNISNVNPKTMA